MKKFLVVIILLAISYAASAQSDGSEGIPADPGPNLIGTSPEYPGGTFEMMKFISKKLKYPKEARKKRIEGDVLISFTVEKDGTVSDVTVLKGIGYGCDEEAIRVVKLLKFKPIPGNDAFNTVKMSFPISFKLK